MGWEETMRAAEAAKSRMLTNRSVGERAFSRLIAEHQGDGMVHFQRGLAYESLNETALAIKDFQMARSLFPKQNGNSLPTRLCKGLPPSSRIKRLGGRERPRRSPFAKIKLTQIRNGACGLSMAAMNAFALECSHLLEALI